MPSITFRGVEIMSMSMRGRNNAHMVTVTMHADLSKTVIEHFGWRDVLLATTEEEEDKKALVFRDGWTDVSLEGNLGAETFILTPNGTEMKKFEIDSTCNEISHFKAVKTESEKGGSVQYKLCFQMKTAADLVEAHIGRYWRKVGKGAAALKVGYVKQEEFPLEAAAEAEDTKGPALASAREMGAGRGRRPN